MGTDWLDIVRETFKHGPGWICVFLAVKCSGAVPVLSDVSSVNDAPRVAARSRAEASAARIVGAANFNSSTGKTLHCTEKRAPELCCLLLERTQAHLVQLGLPWSWIKAAWC